MFPEIRKKIATSTMHDMAPSTSGLKRKLDHKLPGSFSLSHSLKAFARRKITTNKELDIMREQNHQETHSPYEVSVLLPTGSSITLELDNRGVSVKEFVNLVRVRVVNSVDYESEKKKRQILWGPHVYVEDVDKNAVQDGRFYGKDLPSPRKLILKDGGPDFFQSDKEFCNGTADLQELSCDDVPPEYTCFAALADLLDNSLQAVSALSVDNLRLIRSISCSKITYDELLKSLLGTHAHSSPDASICEETLLFEMFSFPDAANLVYALCSKELHYVDMDKREGKLILFDSGKGMDASSISSWGVIGASNGPSFQATGSSSPFLTASFGNSGYGFVGALQLGKTVTISSRTQNTSRVTVMHLRRSTWEEGTQVWKTSGEPRDATKEEVHNSRHGSFTKVEITDLKGELSHWTFDDMRGKLKDYYFPYIQEETSNGGTLSPVTIMALGVNLAKVEGGEVAVIQSLSSKQKPFVVDLQLIDKRGGDRAHARIACHYLPVTKGKEASHTKLRTVREEKTDISENESGDSLCVMVRWLGRLLPDARRVMPFMQCTATSKAHEQHLKRVKTLVDTDAGFVPTTSKTNLAADHVFTESLMSLGISQGGSNVEKRSSNVHIIIQKDRRTLTSEQLCSTYIKWVKESSATCDMEEDKDIRDKNSPTCICKPHNREEMGITHEVFQVTWKMRIQGKEWNSKDEQRGPIRFKLLKQSGPHQYFTVECFLREGLPDSSGTTHIICRPIHVTEELGSRLVKGQDPTFYLQESKAVPLNEKFLAKFQVVDEITWAAYEDKLYGADPAFVELLNDLEVQKFGSNGAILGNLSVEAGFTLPIEILAVVRPRSCAPHASEAASNFQSNWLYKTEQRTIISDPMEIKLDIRFMEFVSEENILTEEQVLASKTVYTCIQKSCIRSNIKGLYAFATENSDLRTLFETTGTYLLAFSVVSEKNRNVAPAVARINVSASEEVERWQLCSHLGACYKHPGHWKLETIKTRLGTVLEDSLYLTGFDEYNNPVAFSNIPEEIHLEIGKPDGEAVQISATIPAEGMSLTVDNRYLELKNIEIGCGSLAQIAPNYDPHLWILIHNFPVASFKFTVFPGEPTSIALKECDRLDNCLRPGQIIEKFVLQVFDDSKNVVEKGREIQLGIEGLELLDKQNSIRQVGEDGCLNLGRQLKVTAGYSSKGSITILSDKGKPLLALNFHTVYRSLRILKEPEEACVGSQLEDLEVQVVDENGNMDHKMDGLPHSLTIDWIPKSSIPLTCGACTLPTINMPEVPGTWRGRVAHALHPELFFVLEVEVVPASAGLDDIPSPLVLSPAQETTETLLQHWNVKKEVSDTSGLREEYERQLREFIDRNQKLQRKLREQGRKVKKAEEELQVLKRTRKEVDDTVSLWKDELRSFESVAMASEGMESMNQKNAGASHVDLIEVLKKQGNPPGSHAASILLEAVMNNNKVFCAGGAGCDVLGIVALLASVEDDLLNRALVDYLGIEKMLMIVCRSEDGLKYLHSPDSNVGLGEELTLHAFARSKNRNVTGRFRVLILDEASFYARQEGLERIDVNHPQKLLNIPDPGPSNKPRPDGFIGYAVNLLRFNPQQLKCYATPAKHSLRESLFFQLFSDLQVYDTKANMLNAQEFLTMGAVSLDGGLIRAKSSLEHVLGEEPAVKFPIVPDKAKLPEQNLAIVSSNSLFQETQFVMNVVQFELSKKIEALHEETGYTRLSLHIKKMETKLIRARGKISAMVKEVKREEDRKAEILKRVAELQDGS